MLAVGTRLQDFTTGSWALFQSPDRRIIGAQRPAPSTPASTARCRWSRDARAGLEELAEALGGWKAPAAWTDAAGTARRELDRRPPPRYTAPTQRGPAVRRAGDRRRAARRRGRDDIVVCAAGGLPGELHKLWQAGAPGGYHMEYGFSCMGYEIAGGLGVKMARPGRARSS